MCGFAGWLSPDRPFEKRLLHEMGAAIRHRGPDAADEWHDGARGIGLAHRRLSILDLSPAGHQPMLSPSGRYIIVFNGEIYNHPDLRRKLEQHGYGNWRGHSDTETLLACLDQWGLDKTLPGLSGMFAFALWDRQQQVLTLVRDRMGEKPLYYGIQNGVLLFGSETGALKKHPAFEADISRDALTLLLRHNYIPAPCSIYKGIYKLVPGTCIRIRANDVRSGILPVASVWWSLKETAQTGLDSPFAGSEEEAVEALEDLLKTSVRQQMLADVPLGAFLSGGIDSSTVVALMQAQSARPVKSFTIGFHEKGYNEAVHAKAVARHLGTDHTELYVSPQQAMDVIPRLPLLYDEPFSDASQIPTFLVSQLARQHVTVSLSGDGGDELFGGYNRYMWTRSIWSRLSRVPGFMRPGIRKSLTGLSPAGWDRIFETARFLIPRKLHFGQPGDRIHKMAGFLEARAPEQVYGFLVSHWHEPEDIVIRGTEPATRVNTPSSWLKAELEHRMMYLDAVSYLPDDILVKVDRAAMGVSLETRVPLLDHRLVEFAWQLPLQMKIHGGQGKRVLRQVLYKYVPRELVERPKMGFGVPVDVWLRGPLRDWAEHLLDEKRLREEGWFHPEPVRRKWNEHLSGQRNWQYHLWDILIFQAWMEMQQTT